ncbi:MAG: septum formation initiator family protein [Parcubacteria group bacterium]
MHSSGNFNNAKKRWTGRLILIGGGVLLLILLIGFAREYGQKKSLLQQIAQRQAEISRLTLEKERAMAEIKNFQTSFFVEQEARTKFNLKMPGERVAVVALDRAIGSVATDDAGGNDANGARGLFGNLDAWRRYFFGI